jgi:hypothetical protein
MGLQCDPRHAWTSEQEKGIIMGFDFNQFFQSTHGIATLKAVSRAHRGDDSKRVSAPPPESPNQNAFSAGAGLQGARNRQKPP